MKKLIFTITCSTLVLFSTIGLAFTTTIEVPKGERNKEEVFWLNTNSNVRHNKKCRWYGKTKEGRYTKKKEGRACKVCGG